MCQRQMTESHWLNQVTFCAKNPWMKGTGETGKNGNLLSPDAIITLATLANTDNLDRLTADISKNKNYV